jgi:polyisoprenoid-binding protein YceI
MRLHRIGALAGLAAALLGTPAQGEEFAYTVDPEHTNVEFEIDHLFSRIRGRFAKFEGKFAFDAAKRTGRDAELVIEVASVDTLVDKRDGHLRSADFFDVEKHPKIRFVGAKLRHVSGNDYAIDGTISIRGVEKPITLAVEYRGEAKDPWGTTRASFVIRGRIDRRDFGMSWNQTVENDVLLVGNDVELVVNVEAIRQ